MRPYSTQRYLEATSPKERQWIARHAARVRWSRVHQERMKRLRQVMETAAKSYVELTQEITRSESVRAPEMGRAARRLVAAFANLYELDGHGESEDIEQAITVALETARRAVKEER